MKRYKKQVQKLNIQAVFLVLASYLVIAIEFTPNNLFNRLMTIFSKKIHQAIKGNIFEIA